MHQKMFCFQLFELLFFIFFSLFSRADNSFFPFCIIKPLRFKLKIHLCIDAIFLTSVVSSSELICLHIYLLLRSADTSSIQIHIVHLDRQM